MAIDSEAEFRRELEVFGNEVEEAIQCFYAEQTIHNVAREDQNVHRALNRNAPFWNLASRALQANTIIVLGRIFDREGNVALIAKAVEFHFKDNLFKTTKVLASRLPEAHQCKAT
jgi:hypothetical protein